MSFQPISVSITPFEPNASDAQRDDDDGYDGGNWDFERNANIRAPCTREPNGAFPSRKMCERDRKRRMQALGIPNRSSDENDSREIDQKVNAKTWKFDETTMQCANLLVEAVGTTTFFECEQNRKLLKNQLSSLISVADRGELPPEVQKMSEDILEHLSRTAVEKYPKSSGRGAGFMYASLMMACVALLVFLYRRWADELSEIGETSQRPSWVLNKTQ